MDISEELEKKWVEVRAGHVDNTKHGLKPVFIVREDGSKAVRLEKDNSTALLELDELESLCSQLKRLEVKD